VRLLLEVMLLVLGQLLVRILSMMISLRGANIVSEKTPDGKYWIINGTKKWITNGMFADYFVTACRTKKGFSVILVPNGEGLEVSPIKTSYSSTAGTAFVEYNNVKVPVDHLMGEEDKGFVVIMSNFNHERFGMCCGTIRKQRTIVEECLKWSNQRILFGKRLIDQPAIRQKYVLSIRILMLNAKHLLGSRK
jgi:alkylation response protein AidB-like acyl-CoA dehydrogenase